MDGCSELTHTREETRRKNLCRRYRRSAVMRAVSATLNRLGGNSMLLMPGRMLTSSYGSRVEVGMGVSVCVFGGDEKEKREAKTGKYSAPLTSRKS